MTKKFTLRGYALLHQKFPCFVMPIFERYRKLWYQDVDSNFERKGFREVPSRQCDLLASNQTLELKEDEGLIYAFAWNKNVIFAAPKQQMVDYLSQRMATLTEYPFTKLAVAKFIKNHSEAKTQIETGTKTLYYDEEMKERLTKHKGDSKAQNLLLEKLQSLKEPKLQSDILTPLFLTLGYDSVDQHGGPDEHGIDLICWRKDELDDIELAVAQIKLFKPGRKTYSSQGFAYLITQLSQACEKPVPHSSGQAYLPRTVYFVTPYALNVRTLSARFEKVAALRQVGVKIIDGPKLAHLLQTRLPELTRKLLGHTPDIKNVVANQLNNDILLDALNCPTRHRIDDLYTNLDFSLGGRGARIFLLAKLAPRKVEKEFNEADWHSFQYLSSLTERVLGTRLCTEPDDRIELKYRTALAVYEEYCKELGTIQKKIAPLEEQVCALETSLLSVLCLEECKHKNLCVRIRDTISMLKRVLTSPETVREFLSSEKFSNVMKDIRKDLSNTWGYSVVGKGAIKSGLPKMEKLARRALPVAAKHLHLRKYKRPSYSVQIAARKLCQAIQKERRWIMSQFRLFHRVEPGPSELKSFLERSRTLLDCARQLFRRRYLLDTLGLPGTGEYILDTKLCRLEMSVHRILDCGLNTLVLGEAGAGKTTTLQIYAKTRDGEKLCIYIALPSLISLMSRESESSDTLLENRLVSYVAQYLSSAGCSVKQDELARLFSSGNVVLELDGIDEVIVKAPWLLSELQRFSKTYPATQIITSSRISSGAFVDDLSFVTLTLLPFSDVQCKMFIRNWFGKGSPPEEQNAEQIISHLEKNVEMATIVRNPLLATVMCVLQEHGFPFPETEVRLYADRMELLLGRYDEAKGAKQLKSNRQVLKDVAARIAFVLHSHRIRHADLSEVMQIAEDYVWGKSTKKIYLKAVEELLRPCEVLVPMTDVGGIGFGHLRYQEYLAASYLSSHRDQDLVVLGSDPWWREVFILLAKMYPDAEWLIAALADRGLQPCLSTIKAIISVYPPQERSRLIEVARCFRDIEYMDLVSDAASRPHSYPDLDPEITMEYLLNHRDSIRGKIHNIS